MNILNKLFLKEVALVVAEEECVDDANDPEHLASSFIQLKPVLTNLFTINSKVQP